MVGGADIGRRERVIEPLVQVSVGKEVETDHGQQVGQRPSRARAELKEAEHEDGDQSGPDLDVQRVLGCAYERLDPQVLLDGLEERLDLPALSVDLGDGGSGQIQAIGEEDVLFPVGVDELDPAETNGLAVYLGMMGGEGDDLVSENSLPPRWPALDYFIAAVVLHAGDEPDVEQGQLGEPQVVVVSAIEHHDRA